MLYSFLTSLIDQYSILNVFRYLTFRTGLSVVSSIAIVFLIDNDLFLILSTSLQRLPTKLEAHNVEVADSFCIVFTLQEEMIRLG